MASFNRVILVANLTRDPEVRYLASGTAVADVSVAVNEKYKKGDEWVEDVSFVDVTLFGRTAEVCGEYCKKGSQILIEGRLKQDRWDDKESGQKRSKLKIVAESMTLLGSKGGGNGGGQKAEKTESASYDAPVDDEPTPF